MATSDQLPAEATDLGDRILLAPDRGTRIWAVAGAIIAIGIGSLLAVTGEGPLLAVAGAAAVVAGIYLLVVQAQRLEFDAEAVRQRSLIRPRRLPWHEVAEATIARRYARTHAAGSGRRLGGLTLSMGAGGSRRGTGIRKDQPFVELRVCERGSGRDLTMELNRSDLEEAESLLRSLRDREWLPEHVEITVDAGRA